MTTSPPDPVFEELATIPGHVASFSADLASGQLLNVNGPLHQDQATVIQKLMQDVGQLVSRYSPQGGNSGLLSSTADSGAEVEDSIVRKVTGNVFGHHHQSWFLAIGSLSFFFCD
ncbi:hypothetical protein BGZ47_009288 [Haplosporangium gracile]|nr:hypothetical protein BGZ47_009288 [Haplosporangium gracile]